VNTIAKKLDIISRPNIDPKVDDSNDLIHAAEGGPKFVIMRKNHCKSAFFIKMVNSFGAAGGFDVILKRI